MVETIFFDLYETLINEIRADRVPTFPEDLLGIDKDVFWAEWRVRQEKRLTGGYPDLASLLREICVAVGLPADEDIICQVQDERVAFHRTLFANVESDILQALHGVKRLGVKIGLISNASQDEIAGFDACPLADIFDCAVFSCSVGFAKPDPHIYRIACDRLGVSPAASLFVGDGSLNELSGAARVGMQPYQATWFMHRWPEDWRNQHAKAWDTVYPKLALPADVLRVAAIER